MGEKLMAMFGVKRLPPVAYVIVVPIYIAISPIVLAYYLVRWMLGFWTCSSCRKTKWINEHREVVHVHEDSDEWYCNGCYIAKKLTDGPKQANMDWE